MSIETNSNSHKVDYLRISLTDKCNLNCLYCTPNEKSKQLKHNDILRYEEIVRMVELFVKSGITKLRLTGGEPLIKKDILSLITMLKKIEGLKEITLTTNGVFLPELAQPLKDAGLDRINISIDSLKQDRFKSITGFDKLQSVLDGIDATINAGFKNIKLNTVLMRGINDDEIIDFVNFAKEKSILIRFIELFHTNTRNSKTDNLTVPNSEVQLIIENHFGKIIPLKSVIGNGPSDNFTIENNDIKLGFISGVNCNFCETCTRLRADSTGRIAPCLFSGYLYNLKPFLRDNYDDETILDFINDIITNKTKFSKSGKISAIEMSSVGG